MLLAVHLTIECCICDADVCWALLQVRAEKPAWYLAVISGALLRTLDFVAARSAEYLGYLEKGQLPPARLTLTAFEESFVLDGEAPCLPVGSRDNKEFFLDMQL